MEKRFVQCGDNRFEIIETAKKNLLESTNINSSEDEMKVIDSFLFRCWQMGWLDSYSKSFKEYDNFVEKTSIVNSIKTIDSISYSALGICGEIGEIANKIKKIHRDNNGKFSKEIKEKLTHELGDVLWYVASTAHKLGYTLEDVAKMNTEKIVSRQERNTIHGDGDNR